MWEILFPPVNPSRSLVFPSPAEESPRRIANRGYFTLHNWRLPEYIFLGEGRGEKKESSKVRNQFCTISSVRQIRGWLFTEGGGRILSARPHPTPPVVTPGGEKIRISEEEDMKGDIFEFHSIPGFGGNRAWHKFLAAAGDF